MSTIVLANLIKCRFFTKKTTSKKTLTNGANTISVPAGGYVVLIGLPLDVDYSITEPGYEQFDKAYASLNAVDGEGTAVTGSKVDGSISADKTTGAQVTNTRKKGELSTVPNMLKGAKVTASSSERDKGNFPELAIDGDGKTRWCASSRHFPEWLQFDMGGERSFAHAQVDFESDYVGYAYELQTSMDGVAWTTVFTKKKGEKTYPTWEKPVTARYVKVVVLDADKRLFASIRDVYVDKDPVPPRYSSYYVCAGSTCRTNRAS